MMRKVRYQFCVSLAVIGLLMAAPAHAKNKSDKAFPKFDRAAASQMTSSFSAPSKMRDLLVQRQISPSQAKSIALRRVRGGEVVDISRNGNTYRVRVIAKDGRVVDVYIDAATGRVKR